MLSIVFMCLPLCPLPPKLFFSFQHPDLSCYLGHVLQLLGNHFAYICSQSKDLGSYSPPATVGCRTLKSQLSCRSWNKFWGVTFASEFLRDQAEATSAGPSQTLCPFSFCSPHCFLHFLSVSPRGTSLINCFHINHLRVYFWGIWTKIRSDPKS